MFQGIMTLYHKGRVHEETGAIVLRGPQGFGRHVSFKGYRHDNIAIQNTLFVTQFLHDKYIKVVYYNYIIISLFLTDPRRRRGRRARGGQCNFFDQ